MSRWLAPLLAVLLLAACGADDPTAPATPPESAPDEQTERPATTEHAAPDESGLRTFGALRAVMLRGDVARKVDLQDLLTSDAHGVGAVDGLAGEITFDRGVLWLSTPDGAGGATTARIEPGQTTDAGAALLAWRPTPTWSETTLATPVTLRELGERVAEAAVAAGIDPSQPLPFRVEGRLEGLRYHVVDGAKLPPGPSSHEAHQAAGVAVAHEAVDATLVGMFSLHHVGVFTHHAETTHVHVTVADPLGSGHVDAVTVPAGARLFLPAE
jgi:hypothetical protein